MRSEPDAGKNSSTALAEEVVPRSPWRVTAVHALPEFRLRVVFADGLTGTVELSGLVHSPRAGVFADLAPDAMHAAIQKDGVWSL
jgi:hypothetical protein